MNILCTICGRGGSQEIKNKNIKIINGKELIYYTISSALKSKIFTNIILSTDSKKIINISKKFGIYNYILRSKKLSSNKQGKLEVIKDALIKSEKIFNKKFDVICDLDITSPLRTSKDIINAFKVFKTRNAGNLISCNKSRKNPYYNMVENNNNKLKICKNSKTLFKRRQDTPIVYDVNASIYFWKRNFLLKANKVINSKTAIYIMPFERSIDIDTYADFRLAKIFLKK
jgi:CMP-N,N'-diacetyllegionaminic acid synthase